MTMHDMISVMEAYENGEKIERLAKNHDCPIWHTCTTPEWNWAYYNYRVKKAPKIDKVPYSSVSEFLSAQSEHGPNVCFGNDLAAIPQVVHELDGRLIVEFNIPAYKTISGSELMKYQWQDGKGCYKMEVVED